VPRSDQGDFERELINDKIERKRKRKKNERMNEKMLTDTNAK
jgi:hypothetical protein